MRNRNENLFEINGKLVKKLGKLFKKILKLMMEIYTKEINRVGKLLLK